MEDFRLFINDVFEEVCSVYDPIIEEDYTFHCSVFMYINNIVKEKTNELKLHLMDKKDIKCELYRLKGNISNEEILIGKAIFLYYLFKCDNLRDKKHLKYCIKIINKLLYFWYEEYIKDLRYKCEKLIEIKKIKRLYV